jgi:DNA polymerase III epsilon subunit-like protein
MVAWRLGSALANGWIEYMNTVYFDCETGGLQPTHPIIQLAAVAVEENTWEELAHFEAKLLFDESEADAEALKINHYDPDVWKREGIKPIDAALQFSRFLEPYKAIQMISKRTGNPYSVARLAGHNAATFDGPRLQALFYGLGMFLPADPRVRCTLQRALWYFEEQGVPAPCNYKLASLCQHFGIEVPENSHDAVVDVRLTVQLAKALRKPVEVANAA